MSKRSNNRIVGSNKSIDHHHNSICHRKCVHHIYSHHYAANMRQHDEIMAQAAPDLPLIDMNSTINIKIAFHFLAPLGSYSKDKVLARTHDVISTINDDFNNYSTNPNTMNNFRYKSIINQVFISNMAKQNIYLGQEYLKYLPTSPSNIVFELGEIYYYPVKSRLNLSQYDDVREVEIEHQVIKNYINRYGAGAIKPINLLNIWIIDMVETSILGFANFPWESMDTYHGVIINRRSFFPEEYGETNFSLYRTFTHEIGHYLGLMHVPNQNSDMIVHAAVNINVDCDNDNNNILSKRAVGAPDTGPIDTNDMSITPELNAIYDPLDKVINKKLHFDSSYNPLFMNFMDCTFDKYVTFFTLNQIQKMRYMLAKYRPYISSLVNTVKIPIPKYNPDTDTMAENVTLHNRRRFNPVPSREVVCNPRTTSIPTPVMQVNVPQSQSVCQPDKETRINTNLSQLIPNLSYNPDRMANFTGTPDQILQNIKDNFPAENPISTPIVTDVNKTYNDMVKQHQSYNSSSGYASRYPHDQYNAQQYFNQKAMYQQLHPEIYQPTDPYDHHLPPQIPGQIHNHIQNQIQAQPCHDSRVVHSYGMPPMVQLPPMPPTSRDHHDYTTTYQSVAEVLPYPGELQGQQASYQRSKRFDPQLKQSKQMIPRRTQYNDGIDSDTEINHEALNNIINRKPVRALSRPVVHDIVNPANIQPTVTNIDNTPSDLINRVSNLGEQLQNIKENIINDQVNHVPQVETKPINRAQMISKSALNDKKYNKYGQTNIANADNTGMVKQVNQPSKVKFTRTRPVRI